MKCYLMTQHRLHSVKIRNPIVKLIKRTYLFSIQMVGVHHLYLSLTNSSLVLDDKLSTLFNTTGREKNSTGPLKQWLFEHHIIHVCSFTGHRHAFISVFFLVDPNEVDKQELMEKTKMSLSQITVWFTNARVKMRKENKLPLNLYAKKKKKKQQQQQDDSFHLDDTLSPPFSAQNLSFNGRNVQILACRS